MTMIFGVPLQALMGQLLVGLINGSFYALLSLGLAIIFGLLRVINFAHGAQYMLGAFAALLLLNWGGINYWLALILAPLIVGLLAALVEKTMLSRLYKLDHLYGLLFTFGLALAIEGTFRYFFGASGKPYAAPSQLTGAVNLGFMFLPIYRGWVVIASLAVCIAVWLLIEKTKLGAYLRAATENPTLVQAFGVNVPLLLTLTYALGAGLAGFAGVLAAPVYQVSPLMGTNLIIIVFAVVVVGGMGSILGAIVTGYLLGVVEGLTKVFYPEASNIVIFVIMAIVLILRPRAFSERRPDMAGNPVPTETVAAHPQAGRIQLALVALALVALLIVPHVLYPIFLMKLLCFALFASAFNLLLGYTGLLSFGHAAFFGGAAYFTAHAVKEWGWPPEAGVALGVAGAALLGLVMGAIAIRRQGIYFAMITLALAQMFFFFCLQARFTHGEDGIQSVPRGHLFGVIDLSQTMNMYYFVLAVFVIGLLVIWRFVNSPFGMILKSIRENEQRAISLGYSVARYKLGAFVMSAALAGLAGGVKALVFQFATLTDVAWQMSGEVILMTLLGGIGTLFGPIVGAGLVVSLQNYLATSDFPVTIITGVVFMICVLLFRRGLVGEFFATKIGRKLGFRAQS